MLTQFEVAIANGGTTQTGYLDLREWVMVGIKVGSWTAGDMTFLAASRQDFKGSKDSSPHNDDFVEVVDADGVAITMTIVADTFINISPNAFQANEFLQIVSENTQGAARTLYVTAARRAGV